MFGQQNKTFGTASFGQPGAFGGGAAFGGAATTGFGTAGTGGFATPASGGLFGGTNTATPSGGLFGSQPPAFGAAGTGSSFTFGGATQPGSLFSSTVPTGTTSLFGNAGTTASTGSIFGATPAKIGFGGAAAATSGTTVKFTPPAGTETMLKGGNQQNMNTRHQCITAMKEYEAKSLEELQLEDYVANRKGVQQGSATIFGAAQPTQTPGFSFGQNKPTTFAGGFGATPTATGLFGAQTTQPQGSTLFGGATAAKPVFGTATTSAAAAPTGFGGFGTNTGTSLFGGANPQQKSIFGQTATTQATGLFGGTQTSTAFGTPGFGTSSVFGATTQAGGLFGSKPTGFGTPAASTGFNFGQPATTSSLFAKPATTGTTGFGGFGATSNAGFGTTQTSSLFGNKPTGFGATVNPLGGGFAANTGLTSTLGTGTSLFGGQMAKPTLGIGTTFGAGNFLGGVGTSTALGGLGGAAAPLVGANDLAAQAQVQQQLLGLTNSPYGDSPLFRNLKPDDKKREELVKPTNPAAQKAALTGSTQYKVSPRPASKIKPRPLHSIANGKMQMFEGLEDDDASFGNDSFVARRSIKKLQLKKPGCRDNLMPSVLHSPSIAEDNFVQFSPITNYSGELVPQSEERAVGSREKFTTRAASEDEVSSHSVTKNLDNTIEELNPRAPLTSNLTKMNRFHQGEPPTEQDSAEASLQEETDNVAHPAGIHLTRPGYYTLPPLEDLGDMVDENGHCIVENFVVGREGYGNVLWPGLTDVVNADLDAIVHFRRKEITVYPDDDNKPHEGEGFNKKAQVTLDCVWPIDKSSHTPIKSIGRLQEMDYQEKLERASVKIGATFIDYRPETGSWVFEVKHFSKYGLLDDSDDEDTTVVKPSKPKQLKLTPKQQQQQQQQQQKGKEPTPGQEDTSRRMDTSEEQQVVLPPTTEDARMGGRQMGEVDMDAHSENSLSMEEDDDDQMPVPASYRLADSMGVFADDIQLKKASFFGDDDEIGSSSEWSQLRPPPYQGITGDSVVPVGKTPVAWKGGASRLQPSVHFTPSQLLGTSDSSMLPSFLPRPPLQMLVPSGMTQHTQPQRVVGSRIHHRVPPLELSVTADRHKVVMDMGLLRGRSFRVGWGPCWATAHRDEPFRWQTGVGPMGDLFVPMPPESDFLVVMESLQRGLPQDLDKDTLLKQTEDWLKIQLEHSEHAVEGSCPIFVARPGIDVLCLYADHLKDAMTDTAGVERLTHTKLVWDLCVALWGNVTDILMEKGVTEAQRDSYEYQASRKTAFSRWLADANAQTTHSDLLQSKPGSLEKTFLLLAANLVAEACECAQQNDNHRLALALAQPPGAYVPREMFFKQLDDWQNCKMEPFIEVDILKVYCLQAGLMTWSTPLVAINTCENLDWKRCLALHFWYRCLPTEGIAEALAAYDAALQGDNVYAEPPVAPYMVGQKYCGDNKLGAYDMCYHLLKLYCDKRYPLHQILAPSTYTAAPLDHHLSWHLSQALYALDYKNVTAYQAGCLHTSYAAQLEAQGLWHWAVFVLLHLTDSHQREHEVRAVLTRHISLENTDINKQREKFLQNDLHIPPQWIHLAKAVRGRSEHRYEHEAWHLQKAGLLNDSHLIILKHIAPDAIINENYNYLKRFLVGLRDAEDETSIKDWKTEGAVYMDYINMMQTLNQLKEGEPSGYEVERLQAEVVSLMSRIDQIKCDSALHRLCQSEMAKRADNLMLTLLIMQHPTQPLPTRFFAQELGTLHLPEDYALQRLGQLTRSYMQELSAS